MVELEKGEVEDTETKAKSEIAAGMWWSTSVTFVGIF